jgi:uncharacterized protein YgiM (DUF1202 family)
MLNKIFYCQLNSQRVEILPIVLGRFIFLCILCNLLLTCKPNTKDLVFASSIKGIYLYNSPDLESTIIEKIPFRSQFFLVDREEWQSNWKKVEYSGKSGFITTKDFSFETPGNSVYVDSLAGVEFFENPGDLKTNYKKIPHKSKLEILQVIDYDYFKLGLSHSPNAPVQENPKLPKDGIWLRVQWDNREGFVRLSEYLRLTPRAHFFMVVPANGLNLRVQPDSKSSALVNLPQNTIGEILEVNPEIQVIQKNRGFWFKTEYQNKVGWVFSGYTITSTDKSYFENKEYIRNEEWFIRYMEVGYLLEEFNSGDLDFKTLKTNRRELGDYTILEVDYGFPKEDCGITTNSRVIMQNQKKGTSYSMQGIYKERVLAVNSPLPGTVFTEYDGCNCCCPMTGNILYFLFEDKVVYISFKENLSEGYCFYGASEGVELARENRVDMENQIIYVHLKLPFCAAPEDPEVTRVKPSDYPHSLFAVVQIVNSNVQIERFFDQGIPEQFRESWNRLKKTDSRSSVQ